MSAVFVSGLPNSENGPTSRVSYADQDTSGSIYFVLVGNTELGLSGLLLLQKSLAGQGDTRVVTASVLLIRGREREFRNNEKGKKSESISGKQTK